MTEDVPGAFGSGANQVAAHPDRRDRRGARVVVVDDRERVLLLNGRDPADATAGSWWFTPGGGVDAGETVEQAAIRELAEETGLVLDDVGTPVWVRVAEFRFLGADYRQAETFFLARVGSHTVDTSGFTDIERASVLGFRWWTIQELKDTPEQVFPSALGTELEVLLRHGRPAAPREIGR
jgi:8-oxo-dGTP pyrophosphatase MutT (NUDIX family)